MCRAICGQIRLLIDEIDIGFAKKQKNTDNHLTNASVGV
jgi:hypothetical protein